MIGGGEVARMHRLKGGVKRVENAFGSVHSRISTSSDSTAT